MGRQGKLFYGWVIVAVMAATSAASMAMGTLNFGLFVKPMGEELGLGRALFGWAQTTRQVTSGLTGPLVGALLDRFGARVLLAGAALTTGSALVGLGFITEGWQIVALFALMGLVGMSGPGALVTSVPVAKWFVHQRGRAMAFASLGFPLGAVVFIPSPSADRALWFAQRLDHPRHNRRRHLSVGTPAPDFALRDANGQLVSLRDFRRAPLVIVSYPLDWSPTCSDQLSLYYQSKIAEFRRLGAQIVGISVDSIYSHGAWAAMRGITFPLLADVHPKDEVARRYHVYRESDGFSERALYVVDAGGIIRYAHVSPQLAHVPDIYELFRVLESLPTAAATSR